MRPLHVIATLATLALWGCSDSTAPSADISDGQVTADVAASTAPAVATSAAAFLDAENGSGASSPSVAPGATTASACTTHSAAGVLTFLPESHPDSITFSWTWEFFSSAGCQNAFDASTTDSIAFAAAEREVDNDPRFVASATETWQFDVVGVPTLAAAATHVWNGVGVGTDSAVHATPGLDRTYIGAAYDTASSVTFPHPLNGATVPASGTFARSTTVTVTQTTHGVHKTRTVALHLVVTFNGTTQVPLAVLDGRTGASLLGCTLDLTARRVVDNSCH
jgi:hypothetical protein